jgi:hypothetical protein
VAVPVFGAKTRANATSGSSITMTDPTGSANDIMFAWIVHNPVTNIIAFPGWSLLRSFSGALANVYLYWQRRASSSAPNLTITLGGAVTYWEYSCLTWTGCETNGLPWNCIANNPTRQINPCAPKCPSVRTSVPNCLAVAFGMGWAGSSGAVWSAPSGYTIRENGGSVGNDLCVAEKALTAAGTEVPGAFGNASASLSDVAEVTIALMEPQVQPSSLSPIPNAGNTFVRRQRAIWR